VLIFRNAKVAGSTPVSGTNEIERPASLRAFFVSDGQAR